jgi:glutathione S-transferase
MSIGTQHIGDVMSGITVSAFRWVPPFAQGLVRDLRVRWALEEAELPYRMRLIGPEDQKTAAYRELQPFGQVPAYEEDGLVLFESGAIVLHIAQRSEALMPADPHSRARVTTWIFAALNTLEPQVQNLAAIDLFHPDAEWGKERRPAVKEMALSRLECIAGRLKDRDYLEGRFTAADLMMTTVLRNLRQTDLVAKFPVLDAYRLRCEQRPAFQKALADQLETFSKHAVN